ncbi:hypothetical protein K2X33_01215 [bacterium]|nr:hypothetical protein [bacterium]
MRRIFHIFLSLTMAFAPSAPVYAGTVQLKVPDMPWVDAPGIWGDRKGNGQGEGEGLGDGSGGAGKNGGAGGGPEFAKEKKGGGGSGAGKLGDGSDANGGGGGDSPGGSAAVKLPYFFPLCVFIDSKKSAQEGNAAIKGMVDEAAKKCDVALIVFPFTVATDSYGPDDEQRINSAQRQMCNIPDTGIAPKASTTTCASGEHPDNIMCGNTGPPQDPWRGIAGCAEVRAAKGVTTPPPPPNTAARAKFDALQKKEGIKSSNSTVAVSIEDVNSCNAGVMSHEALGHSQMGEPNGSSHGHGIGADGEEGGDSDGWTGKGCASMRANAFDNDGRWTWSPNRQTYYVKPQNPDAWKRFDKPDPIFKSSKVAQGPSAGGQTTGDNGKRLATVDAPPKIFEQSEQPIKKKTVEVEDGEDDRHKRKNRTQQANMADGAVEDEGEQLPGARGKLSPPGASKVKRGSTIEFDDNAPKRFSGGSGSGGGMAGAEAPPPDYSGESVNGGAGDIRSYSVNVPNGSGGSAGASITFNDNNPKGFNGSGADRGPASDGSTVGADGSGQVRQVLRTGASGSGLSGDGFFEEKDSDDPEAQDRKKRQKRKLREAGDPNTPKSRSQTAPRGLSAGSRGSPDQTYSEGSE